MSNPVNQLPNGQKRILILGGGFGGLYATMKLEDILASTNIEITLVNRENFFLFTPMLHEVAASDLDITHIVNPIHKLLRRAKFYVGAVEGIDFPSRRVVVSHGDKMHCHELYYDYLLIAPGSITNFHNIPGLEERALTMKSLGDAIYLRNRMISCLEQADFDCTDDLREPLLTFVVAGGGLAGVETVAAMNDFLRESIFFYPNLKEKMLRVVLVEPGEILLPELGERLGGYTQKKLTERKVEVYLNVRVNGISDYGVELSNDMTINASTLVWTAGIAPNPILEKLPCKKEHGRISVNEYMELPEWPGVWAIGDCAWILDHKTGKPYPYTAQHALREGVAVARNIAAAIHGGCKQQFVYSDIGRLAAIGKRAAVAEIMGIKFSGFIAWWIWRTIYWMKLPRFEKKLRVAIDWTLDLLFSKDLVQFMTLRAPTVSYSENESQNQRGILVKSTKTEAK